MKLKLLTPSVFFFLTLFLSCHDDGDSIKEPNNGVAVQFSSEIIGAPETTWNSGDAIGIFVKKANQDLAGNIINNYNNIEYRTNDGSGNFSATGQNIYYPTDGSTADFIAYYPHQASINNFIYKVNLSNQSNPKSIDLLYSNNAKGSKSNPISKLSFTHQLTKIQLNITAEDSNSSIQGLAVNLSGFATRADFNLTNGALNVDKSSIVDFATYIAVNTNNRIVAEAIVLPSESGTTGRKVTFSLGGKTQTLEIPATDELKKGEKYVYNIIFKNKGVITPPITPSFGPIERPLINGIPNAQLIEHLWPTEDLRDPNVVKRNYSMYYDTQYKLAYWVAYPLYKNIIKSGNRTNAWGFDPLVSSTLQPNLRSNWLSPSGHNRGHQLPSADRNYSRTVNRSTFYYTNMVAQDARMNSGIWGSLEGKVRTWTQAQDCDTMYVVTGSMITTKTDKNIEYAQDAGGSQVARPKFMYKALAKRKGNTYTTVAFKIENRDLGHTNYNQFRISVKELESETGFTFFPNIDSKVKEVVNDAQWR